MKLIIDIPNESMNLLKNKGVDWFGAEHILNAVANGIPLIESGLAMPSAYLKNEEFEWCESCKEYDQERHCCHRWTKVIRNTLTDNTNVVLEDIKAEINEHKSHYMPSSGVEWGMKIACEIIDNHISRKENKNEGK